MRVLVRYKPNEKYDNFEGARLRKTIKGALEMNNVPYADSFVDTFDVAHFVYIEEDNVIDELKEKNIPIIVSALYAEDDPYACYLEYKDNHLALKSKALKFLNKANLVLVPNKAAKEILENNGVATEIDVCPPGVNFARFDFSRDDEKDIFYRYFGCDIDKKIVISVGRFSDLETINVMINAAKVCENVNFYYFVPEEHSLVSKHKIKKIKKTLPKNVIVSNIVPDDVYRSALLNADVFLSASQKISSINGVLEAMAAECQLVVRKQDFLSDLAINKKTAYIGSNNDELERIIKDYFEEKIKPTIDEAYDLASKYDINTFGEHLIKFYKKVCEKEEITND